MTNQDRRVAYATLWVLALAFGWIEASVVVYLREISAREAMLHAGGYAPTLQIALLLLPGRLVALEIAREACTLMLLGSVGWLAGRRAADRIGAFVLSFGIWDLSYYGVLRLVSGWPDRLGTWDILFLIPSPWVAPVWAPVTVATIFVLAGSYLFWTPDHERRYRWPDAGVLLASMSLTLAAFLLGSRAIMGHRLPDHFPGWLFWAGVALGSLWFVSVERRAARTNRKRPWLGVRVREIISAGGDTRRVQPPVHGENMSAQLDPVVQPRCPSCGGPMVWIGSGEVAIGAGEFRRRHAYSCPAACRGPEPDGTFEFIECPACGSHDTSCIPRSPGVEELECHACGTIASLQMVQP